ncbi:hypothetical protein E8E13_003507 [Curvularia kusanoi]|uniref:non-specific serine/threonine protein kinase n=1 Tax=Curvularia kusanoi TaxID=90978 RepID=A0A9P4TK81_CURKU|nr:hypothetical protein E8E13_003507 [Curvularia kusanoi]
MDDRERQRSMSLIPYLPAESREIVLRHGSAVVVYDQRSKQLSLRDASKSTALDETSCPYCHRAYREPSPHDTDDDERPHSPGEPGMDHGFVNPGYFQMLRGSQPGSSAGSRPSSPHKQLGPATRREAPVEFRTPEGTEFVGSAPLPTRNQGISARAFSPNYFKTFFVEERELGRGGKGVVLLVQHVLDGVQLGKFACKRVPVGDDHEWLEKVLIEVQLLQNLSHQNLVSYRHVWLEDYQINTFGPSVPCAFILQQYCDGGDLHGYILNSAKTTITKDQMKERLRRRSKGQMEGLENPLGPRRMPFEEIISFFKDITSGLNHLHANGYIHRDLKPSNCLLHRDKYGMKVLVSDFGEVQSANVARNSSGATGTISYCAPEVLRQEQPGGPYGNFTTKSDIFSLGMIVYFMCFARLPYNNADGIDEDNEDLDQLRAEISTWAGIDDEQRVRSDLPEKLYRSLKRLLALNPDERPATEEILHVLKSPSVFDEFNAYAGPSGMDDFSPRISRADTPSPGPAQLSRKRSSTHQYTRPGRSNLGASVMERSPSPPPVQRRTSSEEAAVVLRSKKLEFPVPEAVRTPSPHRLMLPPPPAWSQGRLSQRWYVGGLAGSLLMMLVHLSIVSSSPPTSIGKARTIRELSRSLSHSPRNIPSPSWAPSDSNPTKRSGFGTETSRFFNDPDVLMSTQHNFADETNTLPQYPRIRSTAKKMTSWQPMRSEQINPDTSMVNKEFADFDQSISDEESISVEHARGLNRGDRATPVRQSSAFHSLYDITPPTNRTRKSFLAETGSLRRDAQIRRASRNDLDTASPRPASKRNSPALAAKENKRNSLAQLHAKLSEDESSFMQDRPPTLTVNSTKNTRWGNRQASSLQVDGLVEEATRANAKSQSRPSTGQNATAQSFILPDLPNLTELVSGVFEDGTPVFSKSATGRSRFAAPPGGGRRPNHIPIDSVPIPDEEKAIFSALQQLQDKVAQIEAERSEQDRRIEEQDLELIELRANAQAYERSKRSDSANDSDAGKGHWKVEKTRLDATVQTLRTKLDRADRKVAVLEIEKKRLTTERDNMTNQLGVAFQTCEELKNEKLALADENDALRQEVEALRGDNEELRDQLNHEMSHHREETVQLRQQFDQAANATEKQNATLNAELARVRTQYDENTQQLARQEAELRKARQEKAEYARLQADNEALKAQLASMKSKREEEVKRWERQESALKAQVDRRDETIRHFQDATQEQTNEAVRLDNENLREELAQLAMQHDDEYEKWARKESQLKRKIQQREAAARQTLDLTREVLNIREANEQQRDSTRQDVLQRRLSYRRDDTGSRIKSRVQQESRSSRTEFPQSSRSQENMRRDYSVSRKDFSRSLPADTRRSFSAPSGNKNARVDSDVESTTDLSLKPHGTPYMSRSLQSTKPATTIQRPADLDLTELSFIGSDVIAQLRRQLEEERANARRASSHQAVRDETIRSQRQTREDTARSVLSERRPSLGRKSSLKDTTRRTTASQFEDDVTGNMSNLDADTEPTQTKDLSTHSNTGRRRRGAPTEMTSAFIVPDLKIESRRPSVTATTVSKHDKNHDNANCTVCRREGLTSSTSALRVPRLIPVSSRMPEDEVDATLRPARSPKEALAFVVKELQDERAHLHIELAALRAMLEMHDASQGARKRTELNASIQETLRRLEIKDSQIYNLYDVLEGQAADGNITEQDVEDITEQIRAEDAKEGMHADVDMSHVEFERGKKGQGKRVTIRSFVDESDSDTEGSRGFGADANRHTILDDETEELPWEGFEDSEIPEGWGRVH